MTEPTSDEVLAARISDSAKTWLKHYQSSSSSPDLVETIERKCAALLECAGDLDKPELRRVEAHVSRLRLQARISVHPAKQGLDALLSRQVGARTLGELIADLGADSMAERRDSTESEPLLSEADSAQSLLEEAAAHFLDLIELVRAEPQASWSTMTREQVRSLRVPMLDLVRSIDWGGQEADQDNSDASETIEQILATILQRNGLQPAQVEVHSLELPFWGESFEVDFRAKSAIALLSDLRGMFQVTIALHELGHCLENLLWGESALGYSLRRFGDREACAYVLQGALEREDLVRNLGCPGLGSDVPRQTRRAKPKGLAYLLLLMELDDHILGSEAVTVDSLSDRYRQASSELFGVEQTHRFAFLKEQIHFLYPGYMSNYYWAEIRSWIALEEVQSIEDIGSAIQSIHGPPPAAERLLEAASKRAAWLTHA